MNARISCGIVLLLALAAPAHAGLSSDYVFHMTICGAGDAACTGTTPIPTVPPPQLTAAAFETYMSGYFAGPLEVAWGIQGWNDAGIAYGSLSENNTQFDNVFISRGSDVICCITDIQGGGIAAINNSGIIIGSAIGEPFVSFADAPDFGSGGVTLDAASMALLVGLSVDPREWFYYVNSYNAVDDANRIFGSSLVFGDFVLTPVSESVRSQVPEPAAIVMLAGGLVLLGLFRRRGMGILWS